MLRKLHNKVGVRCFVNDLSKPVMPQEYFLDKIINEIEDGARYFVCASNNQNDLRFSLAVHAARLMYPEFRIHLVVVIPDKENEEFVNKFSNCNLFLHAPASCFGEVYKLIVRKMAEKTICID